MNATATYPDEKSVRLFYSNPHTSERFDNQNTAYSYPEVARLLLQFTQNDVSLITTMPSGLGLDFHPEKDGSIWIEFYGDVIKSTFADLATAQKILERAFTSTMSEPVGEIFSDLVKEWQY
jgi:hypothetical protein